MLNDRQLNALKRPDKAYKLYDELGLYLLVNPSGRHYWRLKYHFDGKEKTQAFGVYPDVRLTSARQKRDEARHLIYEDHIDPSVKRKAEKNATANTFKAISEEWIAKGCPGRGSKGQPKQRTIKQTRVRLGKHVYPFVGDKAFAKITLDDIRVLLDRISNRGTHETANRVRALCDRIFRYAISTGRAERNFAADLADAVAVAKTKNFAAITDPFKFGQMLKAIDGYLGQPATLYALRLLPLVFVRPGELRAAEWPEIDFDAKLWTIPGERMKMGKPHLVPLSDQAIAILMELKPVTGSGRFLFPGMRGNDRPISDNTLNAALRRLDIGKDEHTAHGFRTSASTLLREKSYPSAEDGFTHDWVEMQLAHKLGGIAGIYNKAEYFRQRTVMMQEWADYLDTLKA